MKSKILKIAGIVLLVAATLVWSTPWLLKGKITRLVKAQLNQQLRAHVNFSDVNLSLFHHFPKITIGLDSVVVTCVGEFQGDTLVTASQFNIICDAKGFLSGDSVQVFGIAVQEPRVHAVTNAYGHSNWNILKATADPIQFTDSSSKVFKWGIKQYAIHNGFIDYVDERKKIHLEVVNLEQEGKGDFNADLFTLKTKTTADAVHFDYSGAIPYKVAAKTNIDLVFHVDNKTHTYSFNTDQVFLNDLKLHTDGFFQWVNDSAYVMNIRFKAPSTKFKNILSMLPAVYGKDFASIESSGQVNFNGFIKGKYDEKHFPAFHTNLFVRSGFFKYPDLADGVENINLGLQLDNPDGMTDHTTLNISEAHAEVNHESLDLHLLLKNPETQPFIDFGFVGKLDLGNISKFMKLEPGTQLSGVFNADIHAKGNIAEVESHKKDLFEAGGNLEVRDFLFLSKAYPGGITLNDLLVSFHPKNILIDELKAVYATAHIALSGSLDNLFDYAIRSRPLKASINLQADEVNLRAWLTASRDSMANGYPHSSTAFAVPDNMDVAVHARADNLHYDNLDLSDLSCTLMISDQTIRLTDVKAKGLDGEIALFGTYSTSESRENPEISLTYDVKGLDVQKTFLAFNSVRRIMPVAKFIAGSVNAHMSLSGRLQQDMVPDLQTLNGSGHIQLLNGTMKDFGPLDKLSQALDIVTLKDIPLKDVQADFTFKAGEVAIAPFMIQTQGIEMEIDGSHGFDQSLDYSINLKVPRSQLGSKGNIFVKNVVSQAADKGIPVKLKEEVCVNVRIGGTINNPDVKEDMDSTVSTAATDLKKEVDDFVHAKLDSARRQLHPSSAKKPLFVQAGYRSKTSLKGKKNSGTSHKKSASPKTKKKHKKTNRHYSTSLKKEKSVAQNSR
jgi:uncharacterized protein involved in outer membrane biogenesis